MKRLLVGTLAITILLTGCGVKDTVGMSEQVHKVHTYVEQEDKKSSLEYRAYLSLPPNVQDGISVKDFKNSSVTGLKLDKKMLADLGDIALDNYTEEGSLVAFQVKQDDENYTLYETYFNDEGIVLGVKTHK